MNLTYFKETFSASIRTANFKLLSSINNIQQSFGLHKTYSLTAPASVRGNQLLLSAHVSSQHFRDIYVKAAQAMVTHNAQTGVSIGELRGKVGNQRNFFRTIAGIFSRKK